MTAPPDLPAVSGVPDREAAVHAEILRWQARYRTAFAIVVAVLAFSLKWAGLLSADSLAHQWWGHDATLVAAAALCTAYVVVVQLHRRWLDRLGAASIRAIRVVITLDTVVVFGVAALVTPPVHFERALIASLFTVQLTQMYFGWSAAVFAVLGVATSYSLLITAAVRTGMALDAPEALWTLLLFVLGAIAFLALQGQRTRSIDRLVGVFERAQEGDFSATYDEGEDWLPDHITVVGRAWNAMRGRLEAIVMTDSVSGCFSRRGFEAMVAREVSRAVRAGSPASMLALDLDRFKQVNDEYGHLTGDEVLREVGALLRDTARATGGDLVARIGGEEFVILAQDTDVAGAQMLADRLLEAFRGHYFRSLRGQRRVTISIGISTDVVRSTEVVRSLMARADEALYAAKRNGRDQAVVWHPGMRAFVGDPTPRQTGVHQILPL